MWTKSRFDLVFFLVTLSGLAIIFACSQESFSNNDYQNQKNAYEPDEIKFEIHLKDESIAAPYKKPISAQNVAIASSFVNSQIAVPMSKLYGSVSSQPYNDLPVYSMGAMGDGALPLYDYPMAQSYNGSMASQSYSGIPGYNTATLGGASAYDYPMAGSYNDALANDMALVGAIPPDDYSAAWPAPGWPWTWPWFHWTWHQAPWYGVGYPFCNDDNNRNDDNNIDDDNNLDDDNNKNNVSNTNNVGASKNQVYNPLCNKDTKSVGSKK